MQLPHDPRGDAAHTAAPLTLRGRADATGRCTLTADVVPAGFRWLINYLTVTTTDATGAGVAAAFSWYADDVTPSNIRDGTNDASSAVAPYVPPRVLDQGQQLVAVWSGAGNGGNCSILIEYDVEPAD